MIKKTLQLYCFLLTGAVIVNGFASIKGPEDALFPILVLPLNLYFFRLLLDFKISSRQKEVVTVTPTQTIININHFNPKPEPQIVTPQVLNNDQVKDLDRRMFLKLIGSAGLTTFLFSIFTSKSHAAFFGSVPGPGTVALKDSTGNQIDPAEKHPTDGYNINQEASTAGVDYFGFTHKTGAWYILKVDNSGNYRYVKGASDFTTNWTNRTSLTYDYFDNVF